MSELTTRDRSVVPSLVLVAMALALVSSGCGSVGDLSTVSAQMRFGVQAARMNLWREAQFRFQRAAELDPQNSMAYNNLAVAFEGMGEFEKAREAYLTALKLDRSNQYVQKNYSRFVEFYTRSEKKDSDSGSEAPDGGDEKKPAEKKKQGGRS